MGGVAPGGNGDERILDAVDRALAGDAAAFAELYERFSATVTGYVRSIVRDEHEAEDVTQQVFLKLIESVGSYCRSRGCFQGWLLRIARNAAVDSLRQRRTVPAAEVYGPEVVCADATLDRAIGDVLEELVAELPLRQRQVVTLLHLGLRPGEVGHALGLRENAVYVLYHRARARLCPALLRLGMAPSISRAPTSVPHAA